MKNAMILVFSMLLSLATFAQTDWKHHGHIYPDLVNPAPADDSALVRAVQGQRNVDFLEAQNLIVIDILDDDTQGLPHQKFVVKLSDNSKVLCVYNLDMGHRLPLVKGGVVAVGGQFKWTSQGGLMHWLHKDPKHHRPDGYVEIDGHQYGLE